jgi:hypothetical protein
MLPHSQAGLIWWIKLPEEYRQNFNILNEGPLLETLNLGGGGGGGGGGLIFRG